MEALFGLSRCFFYIILIKNLLATVACGSSQTEPLYGVDNPVEFIGYEDGDLDVTDAEIEIGRKLTDTSIETVFVVSTLLWNNSIYVPWNCTKPGSRQVSVYDGRHLNLTIPLSYVYGKPGHFTLGFLSFPAPLRYLSLSTLSQKVVWLKKGLALRLRVRSDSTSEEIWLNSNGDMRRSFIHRIVNETLTRSFQRVARTQGYLDGNIYARAGGVMKKNFMFSLQVSGAFEVPTYAECDQSRLPLNDTNMASDNQYTLCSNWRSLESDDWYSMQVVWVCVAALCLAVLYYYFISYRNFISKIVGITPQEPAIENIEPDIEDIESATESEIYPSFLMLSHLFRTASQAQKHSLTDVILSGIMKNSHFLLFIVLGLAYVAVAVLTNLLGPYELYDLNYLLDDDVPLLSTCWQGDKVHLAIWYCKVVLVSHILSAFVILTFRFTTGRIVRILVGLVKFLSLFFFGLFSLLILPNFLALISFTVVGIVLDYPFEVLLGFALAKVVVFDIFKVTRINVSASPVVASCSAATHKALEDLQDATLAKVSEGTGFRAETPNSGEYFREAELYNERLRQQFKHVLFDLCKKYILSGRATQSRRALARSIYGSSDAGDVESELQKFVLSNFRLYLLKCVITITVLMVALGYIQTLLIHVGQISDTSYVTHLLLPAGTVLVGLATSLRHETIRFTTAQKTDAKLYFLSRMSSPALDQRDGAVGGTTIQTAGDRGSRARGGSTAAHDHTNRQDMPLLRNA